ncbi:MAG: hypothetical protein ABJN98_07715 [Roseibium sp.]
MLTGRQTLSAIEQSLSDLRREEADLSKHIERSTRGLTDLQERQTEAYRDLARFRLDTDEAGALNTRLDSAARDARRLLDKRTSDYKVLSDQLRQCESERSQIHSKREVMDGERDAAENQMDDLMDAVDGRLETDKDYLAQREATEAAVQTAEAAAAKSQTSEQDKEEKGKAYNADPLFFYLWQRDFGTPDYDKRGIVRSLDRWVSGLIRFEDARANYAMLTGIPERMARHAMRCAADARQEQAKLAELSRDAMTDAAGADLVGTIETLSDQIEDIDGELDKLDRRIETLSGALAEFASGEDSDFQKAEEFLAASLQADELTDLWRIALATPSSDDDKIVQRIEEFRERIEQVARAVRQDRELQRDISRRRGELADVVKHFRAKGYGRWETTFSDDRLATVLLGELVKGAITGADYSRKAERSRKRRRTKGCRVAFPKGTGIPKSMGGFGGFGGPPGGFAGGGDNFGGDDKFGGGGFKTGGGFGGGGFKTGDTF